MIDDGGGCGDDDDDVIDTVAGGITVVHLLELLLMFNSAERLTADEALGHIYLADCQHLYDTDSAARRPSVASVVCKLHCHLKISQFISESAYRSRFEEFLCFVFSYIFIRDVNGTRFSRVPKKFPVPGKEISRSGEFREIAKSIPSLLV